MNTNEPESAPAPAASQPAKPTRSKTERIIVQGGIAVLLVIVAIEGTSYLRQSYAHSRLMAEFEKAEATDHHITNAVVRQIVGDREPDISKVVPATVGEERYDVYFYDGLLKRRELCVHYGIQGFDSGPGSEPEVVEVTTHVPEEVLAE
jgi:hypothetical protein